MQKTLGINRAFFVSRRPDCRLASLTQKKTQIFADFFCYAAFPKAAFSD